MDHYKTLGVEQTASEQEIKKAYRALAGKYHPDKEGGDTAKFQEINTAYQILSDQQKRAQYDHELKYGNGPQFRFSSGPGSMHEEDIADLLRRQFGFGFGPGGPFADFRQRTPPKPKNRDIRIALALNLEDNLTELTKTLSVTLPNGSKESIELKVPRGVQSGTTIRYPGLGDNSIKELPRADLYVQYHLNPHSDFEAYGIDLVTQTTVNCLEAITGCEKQITGLDGTKFNVTIPPGTQYGAKLGIPGQGLYAFESSQRGKLIIVVDVYVPKELSQKDLDVIKEISKSLQA